jgi:hypothetical protein
MGRYNVCHTTIPQSSPFAVVWSGEEDRDLLLENVSQLYYRMEAVRALELTVKV